MAARRRSRRRNPTAPRSPMGPALPTLDEVKQNPGVFAGSINAAADFRAPYERIWEACERMYTDGTALPGVLAADGRGRVAVNLAKEAVDNIAAATLMHNPVFTVHPVGDDTIASAGSAKLYLNEVWSRYHMQPEHHDACFDSLITGVGWTKARWEHRTERVNAPESQVIAEAASLAQDVIEFRRRNPEAAGRMPDPADIAASAVEAAAEGRGRTFDRTVMNRPKLERISIYDMFSDPTALNMRQARWVAQRVIRNVSDVRDDPAYTARTSRRLNRHDVMPSRPRKAEQGTGTGKSGRETGDSYADGRATRQSASADVSGARRESERMTVVWEMWSMEYNLYAVWSDGLPDKWLIEPGEFPLPMHPFIYIPTCKIPGRFYPAGIIQQIIELQEALSDGVTTTLIHRDRSNRQWLMFEDTDTDQFREDLRRGDPDGIVRVSRTGQNRLDQAIVPIPQVPINSDWARADQMLSEYIDRITAQDDFMAMAPRTRRSALEAGILDDQRSARAQSIGSTFEQAAVTAARKITAYAQQYLIEPEPITDERDNVVSRISRENLQSEREFRFDVEVGSMAARDETVTRMAANQTFQSLAPLFGTVVDPWEATERFLRANNVPNPEQLLLPKPQPQQEPGAGGGPAATAGPPPQPQPPPPG